MSEKNTQQHMEDLHTGIPKDRIRSLKEKIKGGEVVEADTIKAEVNAMTAMYIEEIWQNTLKDIEAHPPGLLSTVTDIKLEGENIFLAPDEAREKYSDPKVSDHFVFNMLREQTRNLLRDKVEEWAATRQKQLAEDPNKASSRIFARYKKLLRDKNRLTDTAAAFPNTHIQRGIGTASKIIWDFFRVLPKLYEKQSGKTMDAQQFRLIAKNSLPVIYALASSHLGVLGKVESRLRKNEKMRYDTDSFIMNEARTQVKIDPELLTGLDVSSIDFSESRTGCPAIFADGPSKRNVISEMYDWMLDLAEKYYLPKLTEKHERNT